MKIGICRESYPEKRCIIGKVKGNSYINLSKYNIFRYVSRIEKKIKKKSFSNNDYKALNLKVGKVNGYHYFNYIGICNSPWIATFETIIPRIEEILEIHHLKDENINYTKSKELSYGINKIASNNCKKIIALSKSNYKIQKEVLKLYPKLEGKISDKMIQINPPQELYVNDFKEKNVDFDKIRFTFVGADFVRKGGAEVLRAFLEIKKEIKDDIELVLITNYSRTYNYAFKEYQDNEDYINNLIREAKNAKWIQHYVRLSNEEVIRIMKKSHIGLLPTWGDTYGFSVLEFQSCGCPVITTNVRALPEINNNNCGWVINLRTNKFGELAIDSQEEKIKFREDIVNSLKSIIKEILSNKDQIIRKSNLSISRIKKDHDVIKYEKILKDIYAKSF